MLQSNPALLRINNTHMKHQSLIETRQFQQQSLSGEQPPPLPMKKKHSKYRLNGTLSMVFSVAFDYIDFPRLFVVVTSLLSATFMFV